MLSLFEPNSFRNHDMALSNNGRFVTVATFTADAKIWELQYKKGEYKGSPKVMDLKGHSGQIMTIAFTKVSLCTLTSQKAATELTLLVIFQGPFFVSCELSGLKKSCNCFKGWNSQALEHRCLV